MGVAFSDCLATLNLKVRRETWMSLQILQSISTMEVGSYEQFHAT